MQAEGRPFVGVLFAGLMILNDEVKVIEFNCRFGDPETQVILPLLENDLVDICDAIINKEIHKIKLTWKAQYAVSVVLASIGYPESFEKGQEIFIDDKLFSDERLKLYFAGIKTDKRKGHYYNDGGRVMSLTCLDESLKKTIDYVYSKIELVQSKILRYRKDIGKKGLCL
jgi:phosphoribosylamine--glycine ligase